MLGDWTFSSSPLQPHCILAMVSVHHKSPFCLHIVRCSVQSPSVTKQSGFLLLFRVFMSFDIGSDGSVAKNLPANARDAGLIPGSVLIPGSGRSPLEEEMVTLSSICAWKIPGNGQRGAWQATAHGVSRVGHYLAVNHHHNFCSNVFRVPLIFWGTPAT